MKEKRIEELVEKLNEASVAYYATDKKEIMSNYEWDAMFDELKLLEEETGYILSDSPTQNAGIINEVANGQKEQHEFPALSLAKSKDVSVLQKWAGDKDIWLSWKLDGLTLVATYDNGKLTKLMTRGNGFIGSNITHLAGFINSIPKKIKDKNHLVVRGEALISYESFNLLNETIENVEEQYANPRNLVSGTLNLDVTRGTEITERNVQFIAFTLVYCHNDIVSWGKRMDYLDSLGFLTVERQFANAETLPKVIEEWTSKVKAGYQFPVDGLVIAYDDTVYASTGSVTNHHATNAGMAFKWQDTSADTVLDHIEWSCATSSISPVAVFDAVQLEGTTVSRASLCNISELKRLGIGADRKTTLKVIKANMIIPKCIQADANGTTFEIPTECPVCKSKTEIHVSRNSGTETLHCTNPDCAAKHIKKYARFVSKSGMDIDGLSIKKIGRFINMNFISDFSDIFSISKHKDEIICMDGFGTSSYENIIDAINKSIKKADYIHLLYALNIPMIGLDTAKKILNAIGSTEFNRRIFEKEGLDNIEGIGPERSNSILEWFGKEKNLKEYNKLLDILKMTEVEASVSEGRCKGKTFVITGDVHTYKNRNAFKEYVESQGGKVASSVSGKTDYLVNNDSMSSSSKNKTAQKLGIPIITEEEFNSMFA